ncbi:hypothetical protein [Halobacillus sp. KGW1]|uniref:hypothetical protein n=1 Tax=Halobacillus sp. KGW1 TaxID=1793726 RepID=UPI000784641B|nr:hypothetical protein [Halobacillus sp. KGW1]
MEKTIEIDGQQVKFRSTAATPLIYKNQIGRDFFHDIANLAPLQEKFKNKGKFGIEDMHLIDFDLFYNILWSMAKTADRSIPDQIDWLDGFEVFPLGEIFPQVQDMLIKSFQTSAPAKKSQMALAAGLTSR